MIDARHPSCRHDRKPLRDGSDDGCAIVSGSDLGWVGVLVGVRLDWAEMANAFAFCTWPHALHPCLLCYAGLADLYKISRLSRLSTTSPLKTHFEYNAVCTASGIVIRIQTRSELNKLKGMLHYNIRKHGGAVHEGGRPAMGVADWRSSGADLNYA